MSLDLPKYSDEQQHGDRGVRIINEVFSDRFNWVFREQDKNDFGIDGIVEIITDEGRATGRLLALQIKCGYSFFEEFNEAGFVYRGDRKHINYWINHSLPVILTISNPDTKKSYWVEVTRSNTRILKEGWKIVIPHQNILDISSKNEFKLIAGQPQHSDLIEILLFKFLYQKYEERITICPDIDLPRDFHQLSYLVKIDNEIQYVGFHYLQFKIFDRDHIKTILDLRDSNDRHTGNVGKKTKLNFFLVADSIADLSIPFRTADLMRTYPNVEIFRLVYKNEPTFVNYRYMGLEEIGLDNKIIEFY